MEKKHLVVINSGSSSIKFAFFEFNQFLKKSIHGYVENITTVPVLKLFGTNNSLLRQEAFTQNVGYDFFYKKLLSVFESNEFDYKAVAVGHRVVHGGSQYQTP